MPPRTTFSTSIRLTALASAVPSARAPAAKEASAAGSPASAAPMQAAHRQVEIHCRRSASARPCRRTAPGSRWHPQRHSGPPGSTTVWPISPLQPCRPPKTAPSTTSAPPMPTSPERYRNDSSLRSGAGHPPRRVAPRVASLSSRIGTSAGAPDRSGTRAATSTSRQPRLGASRTGPIIRSTRPGMARQVPAIRTIRSDGAGDLAVQVGQPGASPSTGSLPRKSPTRPARPSTAPGQVDHPHAEVVDVDLHARPPPTCPPAGTSGTAGRPGPLRHHRWQFGDQRGHDDRVGQRGDRRPGEAGGRRDVGARERRRCVDDEPEHQAEVVLAQVGLADRGRAERGSIGATPWVDLSRSVR